MPKKSQTNENSDRDKMWEFAPQQWMTLQRAQKLGHLRRELVAKEEAFKAAWVAATRPPINVVLASISNSKAPSINIPTTPLASLRRCERLLCGCAQGRSRPSIMIREIQRLLCCPNL